MYRLLFTEIAQRSLHLRPITILVGLPSNLRSWAFVTAMPTTAMRADGTHITKQNNKEEYFGRTARIFYFTQLNKGAPIFLHGLVQEVFTPDSYKKNAFRSISIIFFRGLILRDPPSKRRPDCPLSFSNKTSLSQRSQLRSNTATSPPLPPPPSPFTFNV